MHLRGGVASVEFVRRVEEAPGVWLTGHVLMAVGGVLLVLGLIAIVVVAVNAFALVFVLPALHTWVWLPQLQHRSAAVRFAARLSAAAFLTSSIGGIIGVHSGAPILCAGCAIALMRCISVR